jgi:hypothetical protein
VYGVSVGSFVGLVGMTPHLSDWDGGGLEWVDPVADGPGESPRLGVQLAAGRP